MSRGMNGNVESLDVYRWIKAGCVERKSNRESGLLLTHEGRMAMKRYGCSDRDLLVMEVLVEGFDHGANSNSNITFSIEEIVERGNRLRAKWQNPESSPILTPESVGDALRRLDSLSFICVEDGCIDVMPLFRHQPIEVPGWKFRRLVLNQ